MNYSMIRYILCSVLGFEGLFLLLPALVGAIYGEKEGLIYLAVAAASLLLGMLGRIKKPRAVSFIPERDSRRYRLAGSFSVWWERFRFG